MKPSSREAFQLMAEGQAALTDVEANGMRIDVPYLDRMLAETAVVLQEMEAGLRADPLFAEWRKYYGTKADLGKREQLGQLLFNQMGYTPKNFTKSLDKYGRQKPSMDEEALEDIDHPFVKKFNNFEKLKKGRNTFLAGIKKECHGGYVRPSFNLNLVSTFRSSASNPNLQNQPIRDPRLAKLIRQCFIPRSPEYMLVEADFKTLEFRGAANFWQDPDMITYASDPKLDIHWELAMECYLLKHDEVNKGTRGFAKNKCTFPILYGSTHKACSQNLWIAITRNNLTTKAGVPLLDHLKSKGITTQEQYLTHVKGVEERFHRRFKHWSAARDKWWAAYLERGWFPLQTGFVCHGVFSFNFLMNAAIQGASFHCLLWSLIRINEELKQRKMKSKIICQVHDSILADIFKPELDDYLEIARRIMTVDVRKHWPWIVTPLDIEVEASEKSWFHKSELAV